MTSFIHAGRRAAVGLTALAAVAGCSGVAGAGATPTAPASATPTAAPPTATTAPSDTPQATATATITVTPTPAVLTVTPKEGDLPCLFGPGNEYSVENALLAGKVVPVLGRDAASGWIQIEHPKRPGWFCWVEAAQAVVDGDLARAQVIPAPDPFVDAIEITTHSVVFHGSACSFPRSFEVIFNMTANGPVRVVFQRVRQGVEGDPETAIFPYASTKQFVDVYTLTGPGNYSIAINVFSPNAISESKEFSLTCG